jgi:arsenite oxidase small subunit
LNQGDVSTFAYPLNGQENFLTRLQESAWGGVGQDDDIVAYSTICTHMGCSIGGSVDPGNGTAGPCSCHYTSFDLSKGGLTVTGPATTDLPRVELDVEDGTIYATGVDGLMYGYRNNLRDGEPVVTPEDDDTSAGEEDTNGDSQFDGWFDDVDNYDGIVDETGQSEVVVAVGAGDDGLLFDPPAISVDTGTTVVWEWTGDGGGHNVVEENGTFDSGDPIQTGTFRYTFEESGTYRYFCEPHKTLGMKGAVVVE